VREDFPDDPGRIYGWATLAAAGAVAARPTAVAQAIDSLSGVDGLGYILCDELLTAAFLGLYQFTRQEAGQWPGVPRALTLIGWSLVPVKLGLWARAKQEARGEEGVQLFYDGYSARPHAVGRMRLVVASSMLYNALLAGTGFLTMPAHSTNERRKWRIATGVFGLAAGYAGIRLRQVLRSERGGDPSEGSDLLVPITIASAGAALVGIALSRKDRRAALVPCGCLQDAR
jgi:hypothetical protein